MTSNKHAEPSWIVKGKYFYDPETKSNVLYELFDNEEKAMKFAEEKSRKCRSDSAEINVIASIAGEATTIALYKNGREQFENQALYMIIQDCRMFAECHRKSQANLTQLLLGGVMLFAWAYGIMAVCRLGEYGIIVLVVGFLTISVATAVVGYFFERQLDDKMRQHADEAEKWARQIAYRVFTTDRVLLERIFTTRRQNPVKRPIPQTEFDF